MVESRVNPKPALSRRVMVFRHDNSDLDFRLDPLNVPDTVTMDNVEEWLLEEQNGRFGDVYTVIEMSRRMTYTIKEKRPVLSPQYYLEEVPEFSIHNHEQ